MYLAHEHDKDLLETDLTLDRAVMIASQIESAADQSKFISNSHTTAPVQAVLQSAKREATKF